MRCTVTGDEAQITALRQSAPTVDWVEVAGPGSAGTAAAAYFYLRPDAAQQAFDHLEIPVFANCVLHPLPPSTASVTGINGWPWLLRQSAWEVTTALSPAMEAVLTALQKTWLPAPNTPGMIAARVMAMIINEAYLALGDGVSTKEDIDTAMRWGTNYPHGPFEWAVLVGEGNVLDLLTQLSQTDSRCIPAPLLVKAVNG